MNILVLTSVYKDYSNGSSDASTNIVNSFVYKWVEMGHKVVVIHSSHCYPRIIHSIPQSIKKKLASSMGFYIPDYKVIAQKHFIDKGVEVIRLPIKKLIPHSSPSEKAIVKQHRRILAELKKLDFVPDVITGHWASPQMELISRLKRDYNVKTAVVLHGNGYIDSPKFMAMVDINGIDRIGGRSHYQTEQIKDILSLNTNPFVCNSGVPDEYVLQYADVKKDFNSVKKWKIAYVGRLVKYKNIDATIRALSEIKDVDWEFNIVGDGAEMANLQQLCCELNCIDRVNFLGRIPRDEVMKVLAETHIFVMISTNEVFGLVYLEAMAAGCITVASKYGGVDGIIANEENGYLCTEGDSEELTGIISRIVSEKDDALDRISHNARITANEYTDYKVAERYLKEITQ